MKKARSNFQCQDMSVQHCIYSKRENPKYHRTHHTPGHNLPTKKTTRCYQRNNQLNKWMKIIKHDCSKLLEILVVCWSHRPHNVDSTKITWGGTDKANNRDRKTDNTSIYIKIIQKEWNDSPHIFRCILHIRSIGIKYIRWIFLSYGQNPTYWYKKSPRKTG